MDLEQFAMAALMIVGLVNGIKIAVIERNWPSFTLWAVAVVSGLLFGAFHWFGLPSAEVGLAVALSSSGAYKIAQKVGGK